MDLLESVEKVRGVGEKTAKMLARAGVRTVRDLLYNFPKGYDNFAGVVKMAELRPGMTAVRGWFVEGSSRQARGRRLTITEAVFRDETGSLRVTWFNQEYRLKSLDKNVEYFITGKYELRNGRYGMTSPSVVRVDKVGGQMQYSGDRGMDGGRDYGMGERRRDGGMNDGAERRRGGGVEILGLRDETKVSPVYRANGGIKSEQWRKLIKSVEREMVAVERLLPEEEMAEVVKFGPEVRARSIYRMHFPKNLAEVEKAKKYLAFEEIFVLVLAARLNKIEQRKLVAPEMAFNLERTKRLVEGLSFQLTGAQRRAAWEILQDVEKQVPMNRLLQGDVGSGKTVVAALACEQVAGAGGQVAVLAPTGVLAKQHAVNLAKILAGAGISVELLTGATKRKAELKARILKGEVDVVVGTHALLVDDTRFANLALCVIDEQHRFGVEQRQKLLMKSREGLAPHLLAMTATPIPRSLQLTVFGDLEVSILNELPAGRQPIVTKILHENEIATVLFGVMRERLERGEQVYWICKSIEDEETSELVSVKRRAKRLSEAFSKWRVEFLHGKMKATEKDDIMERFEQGEIDILVSTTVVEVGVDVPNATLIAIENADLYGLAQLHQLRGRVGRGQKASECYLITAGEGLAPRRLLEMVRSNDGFYLAEVDLKMRGPGEIYGNLQHGEMNLKIATFADTQMIALVNKCVKICLKKGIDVVKYKELASLLKKYQQLTTLN